MLFNFSKVIFRCTTSNLQVRRKFGRSLFFRAFCFFLLKAQILQSVANWTCLMSLLMD